jgi:hypothetical protein
MKVYTDTSKSYRSPIPFFDSTETLAICPLNFYKHYFHATNSNVTEKINKLRRKLLNHEEFKRMQAILDCMKASCGVATMEFQISLTRNDKTQAIQAYNYISNLIMNSIEYYHRNPSSSLNLLAFTHSIEICNYAESLMNDLYYQYCLLLLPAIHHDNKNHTSTKWNTLNAEQMMMAKILNNSLSALFTGTNISKNILSKTGVFDEVKKLNRFKFPEYYYSIPSHVINNNGYTSDASFLPFIHAEQLKEKIDILASEKQFKYTSSKMKDLICSYFPHRGK